MIKGGIRRQVLLKAALVKGKGSVFNMKNIAVVLLAGITILASCYSPRYIYSPSPPNNPYFTEKGESKLAVYYSGGGNANSLQGEKNHGYDIQGAYAISKNWALTAGYFKRHERDVYTLGDFNFFDSSFVNYKRSLTDIGGGYFLPLDKKNTSSFNAFGGLAFGEFSFTDKGIDQSGFSYNRFYKSHIVKWYVQPSLNILPGKNFRASFISKFSFVHYGNISTSYTNEELQYFYLDKVKNKTLFFFEPAINMQAGLSKCEWLKIEAAVTYATDPYKGGSNIQSRNFMGSIGLSFDFSRLKK